VNSPEAAPLVSLSIRNGLQNAMCPIKDLAEGEIQLHHGHYEKAAAPGSAAMTTVRLGDTWAFGDVNGDGTEDAAVTLAADSERAAPSLIWHWF
jgi:hypothetical protein